MSHIYAPRVNEGGNYCGHVPAKPRLVPAKPISEKSPLILRRLTERMADFYWSPQVLPSLNSVNNSVRMLRSERREGCLLVLSAILKLTDVASLRVGIPTAEGFSGITIPLLARHAGVSLRRAQRVIANLKSAGLLTVAAVTERMADGTYKGVAAVKAVSKHLWGCFGLLDMLKHEREKAAARARKVQRKNGNLVSRARSRAALSMDAMRAAMPGIKREKSPARMADPEAARRIALREIELRIQRPDIPIEEIKRQARQEAF